MENLLLLFSASLYLYLFVALLNVFYKYWRIPHRVQFIMNSQGIRGPPYEFIHGNNKEAAQMLMKASTKPMALTHNIFPKVMPHVYSWINKYGGIGGGGGRGGTTVARWDNSMLCLFVFCVFGDLIMVPTSFSAGG
ncbi:hypothetical protein CXB51_036040 [Gossypium anomalum]|uniref:Cytochrome P450 n=1 Tax=Gossypium anomalum TaxID=47600 RepID=A0A8J5XZ62_9ROSI|nr:hypothetical protein CXB51_036040 [Gossypium anomalum]